MGIGKTVKHLAGRVTGAVKHAIKSIGRRLTKRSVVRNVHAQTRAGIPQQHLTISKDHSAGRGMRMHLARTAKIHRQRMTAVGTHGSRGGSAHSPAPKPTPQRKAAPPKPAATKRKRTSSRMRKIAAPPKAKRSFGKALSVDTRQRVRGAQARRAHIMAGKTYEERRKRFHATITQLRKERKAKKTQPQVDKSHYRKARKAIPKPK